jgi:hypothetical protein
MGASGTGVALSGGPADAYRELARRLRARGGSPAERWAARLEHIARLLAEGRQTLAAWAEEVEQAEGVAGEEHRVRDLRERAGELSDALEELAETAEAELARPAEEMLAGPGPDER